MKFMFALNGKHTLIIKLFGVINLLLLCYSNINPLFFELICGALTSQISCIMELLFASCLKHVHNCFRLHLTIIVTFANTSTLIYPTVYVSASLVKLYLISSSGNISFLFVSGECFLIWVYKSYKINTFWYVRNNIRQQYRF